MATKKIAAASTVKTEQRKKAKKKKAKRGLVIKLRGGKKARKQLRRALKPFDVLGLMR